MTTEMGLLCNQKWVPSSVWSLNAVGQAIGAFSLGSTKFERLQILGKRSHRISSVFSNRKVDPKFEWWLGSGQNWSETNLNLFEPWSRTGFPLGQLFTWLEDFRHVLGSNMDILQCNLYNWLRLCCRAFRRRKQGMGHVGQVRTESIRITQNHFETSSIQCCILSWSSCNFTTIMADSKLATSSTCTSCSCHSLHSDTPIFARIQSVVVYQG